MASCLLIKNDGIGDLIVSSGIISYLAENVYESLDLVTCAANHEVAESIPGINRIFYISRDSISSLRYYSKFFGKVPFLKSQRIPWSNDINDFRFFYIY